MNNLHKLGIVLIEPEIPQNTGNIARTCACTGASLHLIRPLGFEIDDKKLRRAGLDYWDKLDINFYDSYDEFLQTHSNADIYYATTKGTHVYSDVDYSKNESETFLVFGKETAGIDESILKANRDTLIRIPMVGSLRSLNLSNSVAIVTYEVLRQWNFTDFVLCGKFFYE